jgi:hypothetical protein
LLLLLLPLAEAAIVVADVATASVTSATIIVVFSSCYQLSLLSRDKDHK